MLGQGGGSVRGVNASAARHGTARRVAPLKLGNQPVGFAPVVVNGLEVIVVEGQGRVDIREAQVRVSLYDLVGGHCLALVFESDLADFYAGASDDRSPWRSVDMKRNNRLGRHLPEPSSRARRAPSMSPLPSQREASR